MTQEMDIEPAAEPQSIAVRLLSFAFAASIVPVAISMQWLLRWLCGPWPEAIVFLSHYPTGFVVRWLLVSVMSSIPLGLLYCIMVIVAKSSTRRRRIDELRSSLTKERRP